MVFWSKMTLYMNATLFRKILNMYFFKSKRLAQVPKRQKCFQPDSLGRVQPNCLSTVAHWKAALVGFRMHSFSQASALVNPSLQRCKCFSFQPTSRAVLSWRGSWTWMRACSGAFESCVSRLSNALLQAIVHASEHFRRQLRQLLSPCDKRLFSERFLCADDCLQWRVRKIASTAFQQASFVKQWAVCSSREWWLKRGLAREGIVFFFRVFFQKHVQKCAI